MSRPSPEAINKAIAEALGVDPADCLRITIELQAGKFPSVYVVKTPKPFCIDANGVLITTLSSFELTPKEPTP